MQPVRLPEIGSKVPTPKSLSLNEFFDSYETASGRRLNDDQRAAVSHDSGPLLVMAGPGSGKSEVMVARALKLVLVDGHLPQSIFLTTFTDKAARNLQDRVSTRLLQMNYSTALDDLRVGTLHSLCDRIMREFRFQEHADRRLLDQTEQSFFIYSKFRAWMKERLDLPFWESFRFLHTSASRARGPNEWQKVGTLSTLMNRVIDEDVDLDRLAHSNRLELQLLASAVSAYHALLVEEHRSDFSTLQLHFRAFLASQQGSIFLQGSSAKLLPPLAHVLVDEYQDTNPIQESIYLQLAKACGGNITVVGDDDQALYRFRGGTVDCLVRFSERCNSQLKQAPRSVQLRTNYRSLPEITKWAEKVLFAPAAMKIPGARAPKKPMVNHRPHIGEYDSVALVTGENASSTAEQVSQIIAVLIERKTVTDPSQIAILLRSTRESPRNAGPLCAALRRAGVPFYNPRSKSFLKAEEVAVMLGALIELVDVGFEIGTTLKGRMMESINEWRAAYSTATKTSAELSEYVKSVHSELLRLKPGEYLPTTLRDIFYRLLSRAPFASWQEDATRTFRLGQISAVLESFSSVDGDSLRVSSSTSGRFSHGWVRAAFYYRFIGYLHQTALDDPDDVDHEIVPGRVQIMTVHQAKGLEFPVVFVGSLDGRPAHDDATYTIEDLLVQFARRPRPLSSAIERAFQDLARFYYVAYTRAENALVLFGHETLIKKATLSLARFEE